MTLKNDLFNWQFPFDGQLVKSSCHKKSFLFQFTVMN